MKKLKIRQNRQSNFELLRIIAMVMIVFFHFGMHSGFNFDTNSITIPRLWNQFIQIGGKLGVNLFVLISGYFLITSSKFKIAKVLKLWGQVFFYSIVIYAIFIVCGWESFNPKDFIKNMLPIIFEQWWFATSYFVLYLLSPFINVFLNHLDRETYKKMLIVMTICWCIIPTFTTMDFESNDLIWFFYLYSLAGYIKLNEQKFQAKNKTYFSIAFILILLNFLTVIIFDLIGLKIGFFGKHATYFYHMKRLPTLLISIFLLLAFKNTHIKQNKIINVISSATFGVYLIHDNNLVRPFLWKQVLNGEAFSNTIALIPYSIITVLMVYTVCTIIELIRIHVIEIHCMKLVEKLASRINTIINKFLNLDFIKNF